MTKEEKNKDLEFLKEMKSNIDEMVDGFNLVNIKHVQTMVNDWIDELEETTPNNGWIKIESEDDLPNDNGLTDYHVFNFTNQYKHIRTTYKKREVKELWEQEEITHYQPIEKPKPPIY